MKKIHRVLSSLVLGAAAVAGSLTVQAQISSPSSGPGSSAWYTPGSAYLGFNAGRSNYRQGCGTGVVNCGSKDEAYSIYGGSMFSSNFGLELGYLDMGNIDRGGGTTQAHGINLSLIGKVPLSPTWGLFGKVGSTYGRTSVSSTPGSGVTSGDEDGFGLSLGAGVSFDFSDRWSAVLQWERHDFKFSGSGRDNVNATTLGLKYRF